MAARRGGPSLPARASDGPAFLAKALQYLEAAEDALARCNHTAAVGCAVHATISAADAVASVRLQARWKGEHPGAADHVAAAGDEGATCASSLRRVLPLKTAAEYDPAPISATKATGALRAARQAVGAAARAVEQSHRSAPPSLHAHRPRRGVAPAHAASPRRTPADGTVGACA